MVTDHSCLRLKAAHLLMVSHLSLLWRSLLFLQKIAVEKRMQYSKAINIQH